MKRTLNDREINTLLCALRGMYSNSTPRFCSPHICDHFEEGEPLTKAEAERLAAQINLDGVTLEYDPAQVADMLGAVRS